MASAMNTTHRSGGVAARPPPPFSSGVRGNRATLLSSTILLIVLMTTTAPAAAAESVSAVSATGEQPHVFYDPFADSDPDDDIVERQRHLSQQSAILRRKAAARATPSPVPRSHSTANNSNNMLASRRQQHSTAVEEVDETRIDTLEQKNYQLQCAANDHAQIVLDLRRQLHEQAMELQAEREAHQAAIKDLQDPRALLAEQKAVDLTKKTRRLVVALEKERAENKRLVQRLTELETTRARSHLLNKPQVISRPMPKTQPDSDMDASPATDPAADCRERLVQCMKKLEHERLLCSSLRQELRSAKHAIALEIGTDVPLSKLKSDAQGGWKGRAQQILVLKARVAELEDALDRSRRQQQTYSHNDEEADGGSRSGTRQTYYCTGSGSIADRNKNTIRQLEVARKATLREAFDDLTQLKQQYNELKYVADAAKLRNKHLEHQLKDVKAKLMVVLQKTTLDDRMIASLQQQLRISPNRNPTP